MRKFDHPHLMKLRHILTTFDCPGLGADEILVVMPMGESNLAELKYINVRECALSLLSAVSFLHANHILHLDIKPHNVIMLQGKYVLADFDISSPIDDPRRAEKMGVKITEGYRPPINYLQNMSIISSLTREELRLLGGEATKTDDTGERKDRGDEKMIIHRSSLYSEKSDIFALGCTLDFISNGKCAAIAWEQEYSPTPLDYIRYHLTRFRQLGEQKTGAGEKLILNDLIHHMLDPNELTRYSLTEVMSHPYFDGQQWREGKVRCRSSPPHIGHKYSEHCLRAIYNLGIRTSLPMRSLFHSLGVYYLASGKYCWTQWGSEQNIFLAACVLIGQCYSNQTSNVHRMYETIFGGKYPEKEVMKMVVSIVANLDCDCSYLPYYGDCSSMGDIRQKLTDLLGEKIREAGDEEKALGSNEDDRRKHEDSDERENIKEEREKMKRQIGEEIAKNRSILCYKLQSVMKK